MSLLRYPVTGRAGAAPLSRRDLLKLSAAGVVGGCASGWFESMAQAAANNPQRRRSCILLWMGGGPATIDLFDLKPGHANGGPFREIPTAVPGVRISENLPRLASNMKDMAIIRSMTSREGDHNRGAYLLRTGYLQQGAIRYPTLGALVAKELANDESPLPNFVSIYPPLQGYGPEPFNSGFLGPRYAPLMIGENVQPDFQNNQPNNPNASATFAAPPGIPNLRVEGVSTAQADARVDLLLDMEREFVDRNPGLSPQSHSMAYERAVRLMRSAAASAFNLDSEPTALRERYGRSQFGQGCMLARRLVERGVPFVELSLGSINTWDTHNDNFNQVRRLSQILDAGYATLLEDLRDRGMLETTTIIWMGEFGRTPRINPQTGRDHWPNSFCTVLAGGGIHGGQAYGQTSADGQTVVSAPTDAKAYFATIWKALGIDHSRLNISNIGRPIRLADAGGMPIADIVG